MFQRRENLFSDNSFITCGIINSSIGIIGLASETKDFVGELTENISYTKTSLVLSKRGYGNGMGRVFDGIRKRGGT